MNLLDKLIELSQSDIYPYHMPGAKRSFADGRFPHEIDITEIDGFDDLHEAEGILKEAQEQAARIYGSKKCNYLVNGSTCGLLAAISAAVPIGGTILVARNCHKAVYHAIQLRQAKAVYLLPEIDQDGIACAITANQIEAALSKDEHFDACVLTSPTYEGRISDIAQIAQLLHEKGIPLIVDEAHGAHFGFHKIFPQNAVQLGADAVIMSIHKTLPAPTQTALLHLCFNRIDPDAIKMYLDIYETSSPSYVLMAAMQQALIYVSENADAVWDAYAKRLQLFYEEAGNLKLLKLAQTDDLSKIVIVGENLAQVLRERYHLEVEMESSNYVILMTSLMDRDEGFERLQIALREIDHEREGAVNARNVKIECRKPEIVMTIAQAIEGQKESVGLWQSAGYVAAEYLYLYPPGIPYLVPGEKIKKETLEYLQFCERQGLALKGNARKNEMKVIK